MYSTPHFTAYCGNWLVGGIRTKAGLSGNLKCLTEPWLPLRRWAECSAPPYFITACSGVVKVKANSLQTLESWTICNQDLCSAEFRELWRWTLLEKEPTVSTTGLPYSTLPSNYIFLHTLHIFFCVSAITHQGVQLICDEAEDGVQFR